MSELDKDPDVDLELEDKTPNPEKTETPEEKTSYTWDEVMELKKKADRLDKAEKAIVDKKRELKDKEPKKEDKTEKQYLTESDLEVRDFLKENPTLKEYKEDLSKYMKGGLSLNEAKLLIEDKDKTIKNRETISKTRVTNWEAPSNNVYSREDLEAMTPKQYAIAKEEIKSGKATKI